MKFSAASMASTVAARTIRSVADSFESWEDYLRGTEYADIVAWCRSKAKSANTCRFSRNPVDRITTADVVGVLLDAEGRCCWCDSLAVNKIPLRPNGRPAERFDVDDRIGSLDHALPLSWGGLNKPENLVWSCLRCNARGGRKIRSAKFGSMFPAELAEFERGREE